MEKPSTTKRSTFYKTGWTPLLSHRVPSDRCSGGVGETEVPVLHWLMAIPDHLIGWHRVMDCGHFARAAIATAINTNRLCVQSPVAGPALGRSVAFGLWAALGPVVPLPPARLVAGQATITSQSCQVIDCR